MKCPLCGGQVIRAGHISDAGETHFTLCCDASLELIDNYEVYEALPPPLQQVALERDRQQTADILAKDQELARAFIAGRAEILERYAHVIKGDDNGYQG